MNWLKGLLGTGKAALGATGTLLSGVNWTVWLYKLGFVVAVLAATYGAGVLNTKADYAEKEAQRAQVRAEQIVKVVEKRIPVIQVQEKVRTETEYKIEYIKEKLNEELARNPDRPSCALSASELQYYREIAEQTRVRTE
jgi:hypothetical protein